MEPVWLLQGLRHHRFLPLFHIGLLQRRFDKTTKDNLTASTYSTLKTVFATGQLAINHIPETIIAIYCVTYIVIRLSPGYGSGVDERQEDGTPLPSPEFPHMPGALS